MRPVQQRQIQSVGPGTHLHRLLSGFGVRMCRDCEDRMAEMDRQGADWCRQNADTIVDELLEEARQRRFLGTLTRIVPGPARQAAHKLVLLAISTAEGEPV